MGLLPQVSATVQRHIFGPYILTVEKICEARIVTMRIGVWINI